MKLGIIMDPIGGINIKKDSSFAMLLAAQRRGWQIYYMELGDLYLDNATPMGRMRRLEVRDNPEGWFALGEPTTEPLQRLDILLMRKDPPFDLEYIYATYILEHAERLGALVVNKPAALRTANEKCFITHFSEYIAPTRVSRDMALLAEFIQAEQMVIIKPLGGMGGDGIYKVSATDPNCRVILETMTRQNTAFVMAQKYLPEIKAGDKRILLIDGVPVPYALARIPATGETRANLARGGTGRGVALSPRDRAICAAVGPRLRELGLWFVGLDVIGDYLTEINVTSPTCIRELDRLYDLDIGGRLLDALENHRRAGAPVDAGG